MFSTLPRGSYINERISKNYGKEVLLSHWQELRGGSAEANDCIVPGLKRVNACEQHLSDTQDNYIPPWEMDESSDATRFYRDVRNQSLHNFMRNRVSQVRFPLAADMLNNYTSTYTIMYTILPGRERQATTRNLVDSVPARPQNMDLMLNYGNRTMTGIRCGLKAARQLEKSQKLQTTYAEEYNADRVQNSAGT